MWGAGRRGDTGGTAPKKRETLLFFWRCAHRMSPSYRYHVVRAGCAWCEEQLSWNGRAAAGCSGKNKKKIKRRRKKEKNRGDASSVSGAGAVETRARLPPSIIAPNESRLPWRSDGLDKGMMLGGPAPVFGPPGTRRCCLSEPRGRRSRSRGRGARASERVTLVAGECGKATKVGVPARGTERCCMGRWLGPPPSLGTSSCLVLGGSWAKPWDDQAGCLRMMRESGPSRGLHGGPVAAGVGLDSRAVEATIEGRTGRCFPDGCLD